MAFWPRQRVLVTGGTGFLGRPLVRLLHARGPAALAAERYDKPEPVNLGSGREVKIRELVEMIRALTGFTGTVEWEPSKPDGQPRRWLDTARARREFGFRAATPLEEGLRRTHAWIRARP